MADATPVPRALGRYPAGTADGGATADKKEAAHAALEPAQAIIIVSLLRQLRNLLSPQQQDDSESMSRRRPAHQSAPSRPDGGHTVPFDHRRAGWEDQEFCVLDVETTGLSPRQGDRVIEIALVRMRGHRSVVSEWSTLVNPERDVGPTHIHGITNADVADAPHFGDVLGDILDHLQGAVLVAHNLRFDRGFLHAELDRARAGLPELEGLCTLALASRLQPDLRPRTLTACCERLGIDLPYAHEALGDARATAGLLAAYLDLASARGLRSLSDIGCKAVDWTHVERPRYARHPVRHRLRGASDHQIKAQGNYLADLLRRLPDPADRASVTAVHDHELAETDADTNSYLELLDRALEDRRLTEAEAAGLAETASEWGLDQDQVNAVHDRYFQSVLDAAMADNIITDAERHDLELVGALLGFDPEDVGRRIKAAKRADRSGASRPTDGPSGLAGMSVCFTGALDAHIHGERVTREMAHRLAEEAGLVVRKGVTKNLDILVVADPDTETSKAVKARANGTRVMAEAAFWAALGVSVR